MGTGCHHQSRVGVAQVMEAESVKSRLLTSLNTRLRKLLALMI